MNVNNYRGNISGTFGSVPGSYDWFIHALYFYAGEFPKTTIEDNIYLSIITANNIDVNTVKFEEKVVANEDSSFLFYVPYYE